MIWGSEKGRLIGVEAPDLLAAARSRRNVKRQVKSVSELQNSILIDKTSAVVLRTSSGAVVAPF